MGKQESLGSIGTIFASGAALFSDGYANASLGPALYIIRTYLYPDIFVGNNKKAILGSIVFVGIIAGQLSFGWISDKIGRKFSMLLCTAIVFVFSALCAASYGVGGSAGIIDSLIAYRCLLGVGIGGEYPAGSVAAAETTEQDGVNKGRQQLLFVLATNSMLDFAFAIAYFVALVFLWIFGMNRLEVVWRCILGFGILPPLLLIYFRLKMKEPEAYEKNAMKHSSIPWGLVLKRYWVRLAAVSAIWFIYNWIVYPFGLYSTTITAVADPNSNLYTVLGWGCLINAFYIPGNLAGAFVLDKIGSKNCMIIGLCLQAVFGCILSGCYTKLVPNYIAAFAVLYGLFLSFGEFGPGNNLGLMASKGIAPTAVRGQLYGVAAAVGKVGALVGTYTFPYIIEAMGGSGTYAGDTGVFWIGSGLAIVAAVIAYFFAPDVRADIMKDEDLAFRAYLESQGYDTSKMGLKDTISAEEGNLDEPTVAVDDEHKEKV